MIIAGTIVIVLITYILVIAVEWSPPAPRPPDWVADTSNNVLATAHLRALRHPDGGVYISPDTLAHLMRWDVAIEDNQLTVTDGRLTASFEPGRTQLEQLVSAMGGEVTTGDEQAQVVFSGITLLIPIEDAGRVTFKVGSNTYEEIVSASNPEEVLEILSRKLEADTNSRYRIKPGIEEQLINQLMQQYSYIELPAQQLVGKGEVKSQSYNANLAAEAIKSVVLLAGEEFSFNEVVGPRTVERGYVEGRVVIQTEEGPEFGEGVGGGICITSTALHFAVQNARLPVLERHHHSMPVSYAAEGQDTAVWWPDGDYKFSNNLKTPLIIDYSTQNGMFTVTLWTEGGELN